MRSLSRYARRADPLSSSFRTYAGSAYWLSTTTPISGCVSRSFDATRIPSSLSVGGMRMSVTTTSGFSASTVAISVPRSATAATGSMPGDSANRRLTASRTRKASSATTTRMGMPRQYGHGAAPANPLSPARRRSSRRLLASCAQLRAPVGRCATVPGHPGARRPRPGAAAEEVFLSSTRREPEAVQAPQAVVSVLAVDDDPRFLRLARDVVEATPGFRSVGEAATGEAALGLLPILRPKLVLMG